MILYTKKLRGKLLLVSPYSTLSTTEQIWLRICDHFSGIFSLVSEGINLSTSVPEIAVHCSLVVKLSTDFL